MIKACKSYDFVYLTNTPSFYKLNLCQKICSEGKNLLLVLYGYGSEAVNTSLDSNDTWLFDYKFINTGDSNARNKVKTFANLVRLLSSVHYKKLIYAGWIALEYNLMAFISPKRKNAMVCESSIIDVSFGGFSGIFKKAIINRMSAVLPSGRPHDQLFQAIGFNGKRFLTGSVGIFDKQPRVAKKSHYPLRYIFVGRLVEVKNVSLLIDVFNKNGKPLTIVGTGVLEEELKNKAKDNISFTGFIDNSKLGEIYQNHDVFILPSYSETWGLVVEEALYWGLPVIVSDRVGSGEDMVKDLNTGLIFKNNDCEDLQRCIDQMESEYHLYACNVEKIDWEQRESNQVRAYLDLLS
ncbi:MAG: glycosyltransferase [Bacteroidales bacterium]|nr:glycosyltransferase [Bacteroidales bacterium]